MSKAWHIDDLVIHRIVEQAERDYAPVEEYLPNLTHEQLEQNLDWFATNGFNSQTREIVVSFHSYIVETPQHRVLVDACIGNHKTHNSVSAWNKKNDTRWLDEFGATGISPSDIDYVLCTHLHFDHVGWNTSYSNGRWRPTFPNARHLIVDIEFANLERFVGKATDDPIAQKRQACWRESVAPIVTAGQVDLVSASHSVSDYLRLIPTLGHTPGHVAVAAGRDRDAAVFTGDLIHSPIQAVYPDVYVPFDSDRSAAIASRKLFLERYCDTDTLVFTMHFPSPSAGYVRRSGQSYRLEYCQPDQR